MRRSLALLLAAAALPAAAPAAAPAAGLTAGAGRADVTPPTGYYAMGWVRSDARITGQHTRLFARALVLERDGRKVALVAMDAGAIAGGAVKQAADNLADRGFSESNVLVSASHTHAAPTGWFNFSTYNTVFMTTGTPTAFNVTGDRDPQLYAFLVRQLTEAIRRADDNRRRAIAGWGQRALLGLTQNRSLEAHLANHGLDLAKGSGRPVLDPLGVAHTINPSVDVLRVDQVIRGKRVPIGIWSTFADHGTVNRYTYDVYNADHHGSATRVVEAAVRRSGKVPAHQEVVNVFGNTDEGDQSAGLDRAGPAAADFVGREEAQRMLEAWRQAGTRMTATPDLDVRWTRVCFCGQDTGGGNRTDDAAVVGLPLVTGSEEGRGPLYDSTGQDYEGRTSPLDDPQQGHKIQVLTQSDGSIPKAVPLMAVRVGDRLLASIPGEMTVGMGERVRDSVLAAARPAGVQRVILSGLANEYLSYFTTPEEYERQHYEGGSAMYGRYSSLILQGTLTDLAQRMAGGRPAPEAYPYDPRNGVTADAPPFGDGAASATVVAQPTGVRRLQRATFSWQGGPRGEDRPVGRAFVTVERRDRVKRRDRWRAVADDLGLQIVWRVDESGRHDAQWEVPLSARASVYRFVVTGNRYRLESPPFAVGPSDALTVRATREPGGRVVARLVYPAAETEKDFTFRPELARGGSVVFSVQGRRIPVRRRKSVSFPLTGAGSNVVRVFPGGARDRYGNSNGAVATVQP